MGGARSLLRGLWVLVAAAIILYAAVVALGRELLPRLDRLQPRVDHWLSARLGAEVELTGLDGDWTGFTPRLRVADARFSATPETQDFLTVEGFRAELRLLHSLVQRQPNWAQLDIRRLRIHLTETPDGWQPRTGAAVGDSVERLAAMLLGSRRTRLEQVELVLTFLSGEEAWIQGRDLLIENSGRFHRTTGSLALSGPEVASFAAEWQSEGPVTEWRTGVGRAYLKVSQFDLTSALGVLLRGLAPAWATRLAPVMVPIDAELWLDAADGRADLRGRVAAERLQLAGELATEPLRDLNAAVTGWIRPGVDWSLALHELDFSWRDHDIEPLSLGVRQSLRSRGPPRFRVAADRINLATLSAMVQATGLLPAEVADALAAMRPVGLLRRPLVDIDLADPRVVTHAQAELADVSLDSWRKHPAVRGLSGHLGATSGQGSLTLDGQGEIELGLPAVYDQPLRVGSARGQVYFSLDPEWTALEVHTRDLAVEAADGAGRIAAAFHLWQPLALGGGGELWLSAGIRDTTTEYARQFLPRMLHPSLRAWLDRALGDMAIPEGAFIWRGPLAREAGAARTIQVQVRVADAEVRFDPGWPQLTGVDAQVAIDDNRVAGTAETATIADVTVADVQFHSFAAEGSGNPLLGVAARTVTDVEAGLAVLAQSPLGDRVAPLRDWQVAGAAAVELDLAIPLSQDQQGAQYRVAAELQDASLRLRDSDLEFDRIGGVLKFSEVEGLHGEPLTFQLWGQPLTAEVRTETADGIQILSSGDFAIGAIPGWPDGLRERISGSSGYRAIYRIPPQGATPRLHIESSLEGLQLELPEPFAKPASQPLPLSLELEFGSGETTLDARLGSLAALRGLVIAGRPERIGVTFGGEPARLPEDPGIRLDGRVATLDLDHWRALLPQGEGVGRALDGLDPRVDLRLDRLRVAGIELDQLHLNAALAGDAWQLDADSPTLRGRLMLPMAGDRTLRADLDLLRLPAFDPDAPGDRLAALDPRTLPELDFSARELHLGERRLGDIAFALRPIANGIRAEDIRGEITGLRAGTDESQPTLTWGLSGAGHHSSFVGTLQADNLADVLAAWDLPGVIESDAAGLTAVLEWDGQPWALRAQHLRGSLGLHIREGIFHRTSGGATNALLKLIGLINFDTWLRRLQLDFSDLLADGMAFDELNTRMRFATGTLHFDQPVKLDLPSGRMRLEGSADLVAETIDAHLVATLPVGTNLPWIAALAGGLPAAAGVYITSRVFRRQVDRVSSLDYRVTGPWNDPQIEIDRVFSDSAR